MISHRVLGACLLVASVMAPTGEAFAQGGGEAVQLEEIAVEGAIGDVDAGVGTSNPASPLKANGYQALSSTSGAKTQTPLVEIPQSISTVTRQQIDDRNVQTLTSAIAYTPGVRTNASGFEPRFDLFSIRGFNAIEQGVFRDGLREVNGPFFSFKTEPYGLDGVSILKGPASSLYGGGTPGGLVDLTTKRPTFEPFGEVQAQLGSNDRRQGQFDVGGPVGDEKTFAYRVTGLLRDSDTDVPSTPDDKVYIAPAFTWKPNDGTTLTVLSEYSRIRTGANLAYYNDYSGAHPVVTDIFSGDPGFNAFRQEQTRIGYELEHKVSEALALRQKARFAHVEGEAEYADIINIKPGRKFARRAAGAIAGRLDTFNIDNQIELKAETGPVSHTLLTGFDAQYSDIVDKWGSTKDPNLVPPIRLDPLTYGGRISSPNDNDTNARQKQLDLGVYAQDQMKFGPFVATLGVRNDWVDSRTDDKLANEVTKQNDSELTGRAGLTFLGPLGVNPYVSYATSFAPVFGVDKQNKPYVPTTGEQYEGGVKVAPPGYNLTATASVFDITQQNVLRSDPGRPRRSVQTGEVRSKGFELEVVGSPMKGLSITGGYAYLEPTIVKGEPGTDGNRLSAIPHHAASLWADYAFAPGSALDGLSVGAGARYTGRSFGDDENTFKNRAYLLYDAAVTFDFTRVDARWKGLALQVNARNLADKDIRTCEQNYCYRDEGRQVIASMRYRW